MKTDSLTKGWDRFEQMTEKDQMAFLVNEALRIWSKLYAPEDLPTVIKAEVNTYLHLAGNILSGNCSKLPELLRFLNDPAQEKDFNNFYEQVESNKKACAALDIASYTCGFICRVFAAEAGIDILPDPVLESVPEKIDYYRQQALLFR